MLPQHEANNTGSWNTFERYSRLILKEKRCDVLEIINGPIYANSSEDFVEEYLQKNSEIYTSKTFVLK